MIKILAHFNLICALEGVLIFAAILLVFIMLYVYNTIAKKQLELDSIRAEPINS